MSVLFEPSFPVAVPRKSRDILDGREKSNSNFGDRILSGGNLGFSCWGGGGGCSIFGHTMQMFYYVESESAKRIK